jgi:uncharacterized damage-inducible protein DinB
VRCLATSLAGRHPEGAACQPIAENFSFKTLDVGRGELTLRLMKRKPLDAKEELLEAFENSLRVTEYLVSALPGRLWLAEPPDGNGRSIAAMVAHRQSMRRTFAKMGGAPVPLPLDRSGSTATEARRGLRKSRDALTELFRGAFARDAGRLKGLPRRVVNMMLYLVQHEAHHRGQICRLAQALGHRLSQGDVMRVWGWKKLA